MRQPEAAAFFGWSDFRKPLKTAWIPSETIIWVHNRNPGGPPPFRRLTPKTAPARGEKGCAYMDDEDYSRKLVDTTRNAESERGLHEQGQDGALGERQDGRGHQAQNEHGGRAGAKRR